MPAPTALEILAAHPEVHIRRFAPGEVLLEEGPATNRMYVLAGGEIEIAKGDTVVARATEPGAIFGEISTLLGLGHSATVKAATAVEVYEIVNAGEFLEQSPEILASVARLLARRLVDATTYLSDLKQQYADRDDHFGMVDQVLEALVHQQAVQSSGSAAGSDDPRLVGSP